MSFSTSAANIRVGEVSTDENLAGSVGELYEEDGNIYRLVKITGSISAAAKKFLTYADETLYTADIVSTASHKRHQVAGLVPDSVSGALADGDFVLLLVSGIGEAIAGTASLSADVPLSGYTGGKVDDATVTFDIAIAYSQEAQASADGDVTVRVFLL